MNEKDILDIIDDVLGAYKWPDGTLKDDTEIIERYKDKWEDEFEDEIINDDISTYYCLIDKYFGDKYIKKVKIKCRKGKIVIEAIE